MENAINPQTIPQKLGIRGLDATQIKLIAIVLMTVDHIHQMFASHGAPIWLTWIGRPVFPLFLFCCAESFHYTRSKGKYLLRLFVASCLMAGMSICIQRYILTGLDIGLMNNAFQTFFVVGVFCLAYDFIKRGVTEHKTIDIVKGIALFVAPFITSFLYLWLLSQEFTFTLPFMSIVLVMIPSLMAEGGPALIALGLFLYIFRKDRILQAAIVVLFSIVYFVAGRNVTNQWLMVVSIVPILLYNTFKGKGMKYFFYAYYPAHIYFLFLIAWLIR